MIDFQNLTALRESILQLRGHSERSVFDAADLGVFDDVTKLPMPMEPRKVNITIFGFCLEGSCDVSIDTRRMEFKKNNAITVFAGQSIHVHHMSEDIRGIFICIGKERTQELINHMQDVVPLFMYVRQHPCIELDASQLKWAIAHHQMLFNELHTEENMFRQQTIMSMLTTMIYKMCNIYGRMLTLTPLHNSRQEDIFVRFIHMLEQDFRMHREVSYYAKQLGVTPKYLSAVVKSVSGRSAGVCIDSYVVEEAKVLLRTTRMSILDISNFLHFPNQSFFGKYFKRLTQQSPYQFRKTHMML